MVGLAVIDDQLDLGADSRRRRSDHGSAAFARRQSGLARLYSTNFISTKTIVGRRWEGRLKAAYGGLQSIRLGLSAAGMLYRQSFASAADKGHFQHAIAAPEALRIRLRSV